MMLWMPEPDSVAGKILTIVSVKLCPVDAVVLKACLEVSTENPTPML